MVHVHLLGLVGEALWTTIVAVREFFLRYKTLLFPCLKCVNVTGGM